MKEFYVIVFYIINKGAIEHPYFVFKTLVYISKEDGCGYEGVMRRPHDLPEFTLTLVT